MSRIGRKPIPVPAGVKINTTGGKVEVQGPKGKLMCWCRRRSGWSRRMAFLPPFAITKNIARCTAWRALCWPTPFTASPRFQERAGHRWRRLPRGTQGQDVAFALGKSHPIEFPIPEGIQISVDKQTHIVVSGADKAQVGQVAADLRSLRPPDPYKQKGVRITGERLKKKAGKAGAKAGA